MLALTQSRLIFHPDGLVPAAMAAAAAGTAVFWGLLVHWVVRNRAWRLAPLLFVPPVLALVGSLRRGRGDDGEGAEETGPVLPWWQMLVGFGLAALVVAVAAHAHERPETGPQAALMVVLALASIVWVFFFYLRVYQYLGRFPMGVLLVMRVLAILLVVALLFKPTLSYEEKVEHRMDLYVLVDASRSMSVSDWPDTPHRLAQAAGQLADYRERLETAFDLHLYTFAARARKADPAAWPKPEGEATNLVRALGDVTVSMRRADAAGIVLVSDGIHNAGGDVAEEIRALGLPPVYAVGIGTELTAESGYQDIWIENVSAPEESVVNNITRITVDVDAVGLADRSVEVRLREGEMSVSAEPLRLDSVQGTQSVTLTVTPTDVGRHTYTVAIQPDPAERRAENNTRDVHLLVTDPKIRVLYVEGVVRPEYKPLKSVLETDPNVELLALVQVRKGEFLQSGSMKGVSMSAFPQTLEDMRKFDVFVIGDLDRSYFSGRQLENVKTAVAEGRGLVMIGGYNSFGPGGYGGTAMEEMLPVEVGGRDVGQETDPFVLKLTAEGANHPIFYGAVDFFQYGAQTPAARLPQLKGCTLLGRPKPGASVLAVHPERTGPAGPLVVLAVQPYGQGRTAAFAADTTYQWYLPYRALGRESPYIKFWTQMMRYLANTEIKDAAEGPGLTVLVRKPFYAPGEKVPVRAKVRADEGRATNFADVTGVLLGEGDDRQSLSLPLVPGSVGVYETEIAPPDPGTYKLVVEARKDGVRLGLEEIEFTVGRANQEFDRLSIDRGLLKEVAQATGGAYYEPAAFGDMVEALRSRTIKEDIYREVGFQTMPGLFAILFVAFLGIVTAEWLVRKYYQLN